MAIGGQVVTPGHHCRDQDQHTGDHAVTDRKCQQRFGTILASRDIAHRTKDQQRQSGTQRITHLLHHCDRGKKQPLLPVQRFRGIDVSGIRDHGMRQHQHCPIAHALDHKERGENDDPAFRHKEHQCIGRGNDAQSQGQGAVLFDPFRQPDPAGHHRQSRHEVVEIDDPDVRDAHNIAGEEHGDRLAENFANGCDQDQQRDIQEGPVGDQHPQGTDEFERRLGDWRCRLGHNEKGQGGADRQQRDDEIAERSHHISAGCPLKGQDIGRDQGRSDQADDAESLRDRTDPCADMVIG